MKKYGLLLLMVLASSTTAWGAFACVEAPKYACPCEDVYINVSACLPFECEPCYDTKVCVRGNMVIVDMYFYCEDCKCGGATCIDECVNIGEFCPGMYSVIVRIHCKCLDPGCYRMKRARICALGSTFFRVCKYCPPAP